MRLDKSFRVILNSPIFAKMTIDRVTDRSVRFGAQDEGQLRIFIIKVIPYDHSVLVLFLSLSLFMSLSLPFSKASNSDCNNLYRELQARVQIIERQHTAISKTNTPVCLVLFYTSMFQWTRFCSLDETSCQYIIGW
jgi:hypothetical protein